MIPSPPFWGIDLVLERHSEPQCMTVHAYYNKLCGNGYVYGGKCRRTAVERRWEKKEKKTRKERERERKGKEARVYSSFPHCTLRNKSSPLRVGVSFGNHPGVAGNCSSPCPSLSSSRFHFPGPLFPIPPCPPPPSVRATARSGPSRFASREEALEL